MNTDNNIDTNNNIHSLEVSQVGKVPQSNEEERTKKMLEQALLS
jgi:hypothetical protein